ncbi:MAG: universal stress protein [Desulfatitalea sp.]|nr:universal stress protein [Desulfatitalea sp.]NNK00274.1 universal stress protein [Desulfatitalea sp.]
MAERLLHVFRNTPLGRETILQSLYFCKMLGVAIEVYVPESKQFVMYFDHDMVQVDLDDSYLTTPDSATTRVRQLAAVYGITPTFFKPKAFTASQLPDISTAFNFMCCPRSISDLSTKIGLGHIGPKVRRIIRSSHFPVLMTSSVFKAWESITVFYGGSANADKALRWGLHLSGITGKPLDLFTYKEGRQEAYFKDRMQAAGLWDQVQRRMRSWHQADQGVFEEHLFHVPHDALIVVGAYGHSLIKEVLFGSKMEAIQSWMPNIMLLVGPNCMVGR